MYGPGSCGLFAPNSDVMSFSLLVLGAASFLFHASLRQVLQFADELAMLGLMWAFLQGIFTIRKSSLFEKSVKISMAILFPLFSAFYVWTGKIIYHATAFAIVLGFIILRSYYLFYWLKPGFPQAMRNDWETRGRKILLILLIGYILWNIDLEFCAELRRFREQIGLPWAWLFELHGWWHILTAIGANRFMDMIREIQDHLKREKDE
jgi:dihydroceramidase